MYNLPHKRGPAPHARKLPEYSCAISADNVDGIFSGCSDFETRKISYGLEDSLYLTVCWLDGIVSGTDVSLDILRPLTEAVRAADNADEAACFKLLLAGGIYSYSVKPVKDTDELIVNLTHGHCAILFPALKAALTFEVRSDKARNVSEPTLEKSLKGAKDSFIETLRVNTALVRRRICSPKLKIVESTIGRKSNTRVAMLYVDGVAAPETVEEAARRLDAVDVDALIATGTLEEYICDAPLSPFPQFLHTERPDRLAMYLLEGRVGLLVDGLPISLILPVNFAEFMKVTGDTSNHFAVATSLTLLRWLALILSLFLPAVYVAVAMYHQEMIPTRLLLSIIEAKQNVPFSTALEVLGMLVAFSFLQEAGLRLPNPIGDTVSIIGALIVGQSAVEAQVISPIAIIVVATAGIAGYTLPSQDLGNAVRLMRFALLLGAILAGLYGVGIVSCLILLHLSSIDSFGTNYTAPMSDGRRWSLLRLLIRVPKPLNKFRDPELNTPDERRQR